MRIFFTDASFIVASQPRPNVPFLCDREMELVPAPNEYLRFVATVKGRTRSPNTWRTYGENLFEFFSFLEENGLAWDATNQTQIAAWRDAMLERGWRIDGVCFSAYLNDDFAQYGAETMTDGQNVMWTIGQDVFRVSDLVNTWPTVPVPQDSLTAALVVLASLLYMDRVPWLCLEPTT